ncbi:hypothetical protein A2303_02810 [Candidatus Falkowbacteria bacterium RIFOXYB2_FULL_47_14]|uniref:Uncharacterized protein n=1 Tax=Candidatus Falkowbacteria bacterium RIFOXYA2_FULL_47_19 TaxID=1797994 RepID=A0A1F5SLN5_9BACT|nr:MAG: hypothetical protein A2227_01885 [Candidatus Falkowbacteria bacterium RIFOXYA2_FULL_47_19]OGF36247.1 MAG: hypothetical protein A2468_07555 [Candidatus Falkowbacteria bacterium RIFOXYC2_FULL_46_15]OGF43051.1 MAG: hypothetical protein A2303_02810 [Candidatus Falkowbacteria bacterium RIFOXYB2_FULL_47_14]
MKKAAKTLTTFILSGHDPFGPEYEDGWSGSDWGNMLIDAHDEESVARYFGGRYCPEKQAIELPKKLFKRTTHNGRRCKKFTKDGLVVFLSDDNDRFRSIRKAEKLIVKD